MTIANIKKEDYIVFIAGILSFIIPFLFRTIDDNRLTSWQWVIPPEGLKIFVLLIIGVLIAYILSRFSLLEGRPVISLFIFPFVFSALFWQIPEVIIDASRYFTQAKYLEEFGVVYFLKEWGKDIFSWTDMPLIPFIHGLIFKTFGEERLYIQIFNSIAFSATPVITYMIGKTLWDRETGFYGGLLLMGIPYIYTQVPLMLVDIPTMSFLLLAFFSFIKALRGGGLWLIFSPLFILFAILSKYSSLLMLSLLPVIFLVHLFLPPYSLNKGLLLRRALSMFFFLLLFSGLILVAKSDVILDQLRLLYNYQAPGLRRWGEGYLSTFFFQIHPFITMAGLYSIYYAFKKRDMKFLIISLLLFLVLLLQIERIRYLIVIFPMLTLMASYGIQAIRDPSTRRFFAYSAITSSIVISLFGYMPFLKNNSMVNLRDAGEFINHLSVKEVEIITASQKEILDLRILIPILDLYIKDREIIYMQGPPSERPLHFLSSPLRFTWEYRIPEFYKEKSERRGSQKPLMRCLVLLTDDKVAELSKGIREKISHYSNSRTFHKMDGIFKFQAFAVVFYD